MTGICVGTALAADPATIDWSHIPAASVPLFYACQSSYEWLRRDHADGKDKATKAVDGGVAGLACRAAPVVAPLLARRPKSAGTAGVRARPRDTARYRCGLRLALGPNSSLSFCSETAVPRYWCRGDGSCRMPCAEARAPSPDYAGTVSLVIPVHNEADNVLPLLE